jgi:hypothetical protein
VDDPNSLVARRAYVERLDEELRRHPPAVAAIRHALQCSARSVGATFARLPPPVKFRAAGTLEAWRAVFDVTGAQGRDLLTRLSDSRYSPLSLT